MILDQIHCLQFDEKCHYAKCYGQSDTKVLNWMLVQSNSDDWSRKCEVYEQKERHIFVLNVSIDSITELYEIHF